MVETGPDSLCDIHFGSRGPGGLPWRQHGSRERQTFLQSFPVLDATFAVQALIKMYLEKGVVPPGNAEDAAHLAFASIHEVEYLCKWNFKHLANVQALRRLRTLNESQGIFIPQVCTPEELLGE